VLIVHSFSEKPRNNIFERRCIVAKKGAICPIFEGDMSPKKMYPNIGANIGAITGILLTYTKLLHSPAIECKEGLCISRLVEFELLFEIKFEQKKVTVLDIVK
jgi:hypothetical protein